MRPSRIDGPAGGASAPSLALRLAAPPPENLRDASAVAELFIGVFRRDLLAFFPLTCVDPCQNPTSSIPYSGSGPDFHLIDGEDATDLCITMFGARYRLRLRNGLPFSARDRRLIRAIGAVLSLRYHHAFLISNTERLELYRGGSEDHYVAAYIEPTDYEAPATRPSRIASAIQTLRTAALSTYENHRVSTGALLVGPIDDPGHPSYPTSLDALPYGVQLTALKSIHRLCDGERTLFQVDRSGRLAGIIDVKRFAAEVPGPDRPEVPCARAYQAHARATRVGGHVCVVLSPNQEIKLFAGGTQAFAFAHGCWRLLDPQAKFAVWQRAVVSPDLAWTLFQAALNLAEARQGALFVVLDDPVAAFGKLISPSDRLSDEVSSGPPIALAPRDPLAKRALHYLARGRNALELDPAVLESLASLDGALATDHDGRLLAFGAILRHDPSELPAFSAAEGARTTAALTASRHGPVLKVSEDGTVSCFLGGIRAWDL
ncbi:MAG: hypothetical protein ABI353_02950 [Isosphaeraceae bacterium]